MERDGEALVSMIAQMIRAKVLVPHEIIRAELVAPPMAIEELNQLVSFIHSSWDLARDKYVWLALKSF